MNDPQFFGYGSLVNTATHVYANPVAAQLNGWRRNWCDIDAHPTALLSVEPADGHILGLCAQVPGGDWAALDARESGYGRVDTTALIAQQPVAGIATYQVAPHTHRGFDKPILLSYLDVVIQGFLQIYGHAGAAHFFASTAGWNRPVLDDRAAPRYPRAQQLTAVERREVDAGLAKI
ncbi:MAG: gamma-glutamylcyclotransferase [Rhodobacteraceae bacterium]|nr:gamma-glutamylcyclotransferase [Paracoccaceae bacterium]